MVQQASFIDFLGMLFTVFLVLACLFWVGMLLIPFALRFLIRRHMNTMEKSLFRDRVPNSNIIRAPIQITKIGIPQQVRSRKKTKK